MIPAFFVFHVFSVVWIMLAVCIGPRTLPLQLGTFNPTTMFLVCLLQCLLPRTDPLVADQVTILMRYVRGLFLIWRSSCCIVRSLWGSVSPATLWINHLYIEPFVLVITSWKLGLGYRLTSKLPTARTFYRNRNFPSELGTSVLLPLQELGLICNSWRYIIIQVYYVPETFF